MRRRDFIKVIAGFATAWPLASQAQPAANVPVITLVNARKADAALAAEFRKGLSQTGFTEGSSSNIIGWTVATRNSPRFSMMRSGAMSR
jgi:hypothetical protein